MLKIPRGVHFRGRATFSDSGRKSRPKNVFQWEVPNTDPAPPKRNDEHLSPHILLEDLRIGRTASDKETQMSKNISHTFWGISGWRLFRAGSLYLGAGGLGRSGMGGTPRSSAPSATPPRSPRRPPRPLPLHPPASPALPAPKLAATGCGHQTSVRQTAPRASTGNVVPQPRRCLPSAPFVDVLSQASSQPGPFGRKVAWVLVGRGMAFGKGCAKTPFCLPVALLHFAL